MLSPWNSGKKKLCGAKKSAPHPRFGQIATFDFGTWQNFERRLGVGGMAAVWLARDERLGRLVAIKALSDALAGEEGYVRRFRREARVAAGLSHPNLVRVFDFGDDPRPYLVMEYVEGGTLAEQLRGGARTRLQWAHWGAADALDHVHEARIVHRDVKPANVLIGTDGRPRLTDFGIAQPEDATQLTQTGGVMGTLRYLAPEVLASEPATPASDLYALGMLMRDCIEPGDGPLNALADRLTERDPAQRRRPPQQRWHCSTASRPSPIRRLRRRAACRGCQPQTPRAARAARRPARIPVAPRPARRSHRARRARRRNPSDRHRHPRRRRHPPRAATACRAPHASARRAQLRDRSPALTQRAHCRHDRGRSTRLKAETARTLTTALT